MKFILLLPFFVGTVSLAQAPGSANEGSPVSVLEFRWYRDRKAAAASETRGIIPARAVIAENKKFQREARAQLPPGAVDPNTLTIDGRSEALEKITQESRTPKTAAVEGFSYHAKVQNLAKTEIDVIFLEFEFTELANPTNRVRRQFLCAAHIKANEKTDLKVFSSLGPSDVISVESLSPAAGNLFGSAVNINRIEYSNGAIIQRQNWNFGALKESVDRAVSEPWGAERCRGI